MSATPPQAPEQIRGETLTPVSPKPMHYPSPANVPILEASMDPAFSDTVTQSMQQQPQPSSSEAQPQPPPPPPVPTVNPAVADHSSLAIDHASTQDSLMANGVAERASSSNDNMHVHASDAANAAHQNAYPGTDYSLSSSEPKPSENDQDPSSSSFFFSSTNSPAVATANIINTTTSSDTTTNTTSTSPTVEDARIDLVAPTAADPQTAAPQSASAATATATADSNLPPKPIDTPTNGEGNVDYTALLLANLSSVIANAATPADSANATPLSAQPLSAVTSPSSALPSNPNLPPKPPAQDKPHIHPNYVAGDDLRNYHPHQKDGAATAAAAPAVTAAPAAFSNAQALPHLSTNGLPPPPHAYQTPLSASLPAPPSAVSTQSQRGPTPNLDEDGAFDPHTQQLYDQFIQFERQNVHDGQWDKFPMGSRLFIGNLSTEKVHKKDVFRKFHKYGQLAQISLKQAYGFVQFMDAPTCATALAVEQGQKLCGREMHLEISKPAKNNRQQERNRRRSRSPDYGRGGRVDRYPGSPRDRDNRRSRDEWRRSPSPRRAYGGRNERYDDRRRRSPSPYGGRNNFAAQQRDEIDLPWRTPGQAPDIQILVVDQIDQEYIRWVDNAMKSRGARVDVLMLNPRWPEEAVVRRQILEGVLAVVHLNRADRMKNKVPLRLFNRTGNNVTFDQYVDLDPTTAADLVMRAKQTQSHAAPPPPPQSYPMPPQQQQNAPPPQYGYQPRGPPPPQHNPPPPAADLSRIISSLQPPGSNGPPPNTDLSRIMAGISNQPPGAQPPSATGLTPDVARLLGQMGQPPQGGPPPPQQQAQNVLHPPPGSYHGTPAQNQGQAPGSSMPPVSPGIQPPTSQTTPDIQQLLANLTNYKPPS